MKKTKIKFMKRLIAAVMAAAVCLTLAGCGGSSKSGSGSVSSETAKSESTTNQSESTKSTQSQTARTDGTVEYTTKDTKFYAPEGLVKDQTNNMIEQCNHFKLIDSIDGYDRVVLDFNVYDTGFWIVNPHPDFVTPKTVEEFQPSMFGVNYTRVLDFEYSEGDKSESMYAAVANDKYNLTKYIKYCVSKDNPEDIIYMEGTDYANAIDEEYAAIVKSLEWK